MSNAVRPYLYVLKELGGWETLEMVQRYAHLSAPHLAQWVQPLTVNSVTTRPLGISDSSNLAAIEQYKEKATLMA